MEGMQDVGIDANEMAEESIDITEYDLDEGDILFIPYRFPHRAITANTRYSFVLFKNAN